MSETDPKNNIPFSNPLPPSDYQLTKGKLPPQAVDLEEAVLGAIMLDKDALPTVTEILRKESYYLEAHQEKLSIKLFQI